MNSSLLACFLTVVMSSLAGLSAAWGCSGPLELTNCDTMHAGEDGKSCQYTKPVQVCLKEGEWMKVESILELIQMKHRAIGCKTGGKGVVIGADDQSKFEQGLADAGLKTESKGAVKSCAAWKFASIEEARRVLSKAYREDCKSSADKVGSFSCSDIMKAVSSLANLL